MLRYDLKSMVNPDLSDDIVNDPKLLLMLRIADIIITHARIDSLISNLIIYFRKYLKPKTFIDLINEDICNRCKIKSITDLTDEFIRRMGFEQKRVVLYNLLKKYGIDRDADFLNELKINNIDLLEFIRSIQKLENPRNNLAHKDTLIEIYRIIEKYETKIKHPELLNDEHYRELTGIGHIGEIADMNQIYHRYNDIIAPYNFLIDMLNLDMDEKLVREILGLSTKEYLTSDGERVYL